MLRCYVERHCEQSCCCRFHERLYHVLLWERSCCVVSSSSNFPKNVETINFWFILHGIIYYWNRPAVRLSAIWDSRSSSYSDKQTKAYALATLYKNLFWKLSILKQILLCNNARLRTSSSNSITSTELTEPKTLSQISKRKRNLNPVKVQWLQCVCVIVRLEGFAFFLHLNLKISVWSFDNDHPSKLRAAAPSRP